MPLLPGRPGRTRDAYFEAALAREDSVAAWEGLAGTNSRPGNTSASLEARARAFRANRAADDLGGAVRMAGWLANDALIFATTTWLRRAGSNAAAHWWVGRTKKQ
jgi:hypothetical protein